MRYESGRDCAKKRPRLRPRDRQANVSASFRNEWQIYPRSGKKSDLQVRLADNQPVPSAAHTWIERRLEIRENDWVPRLVTVFQVSAGRTCPRCCADCAPPAHLQEAS